MKQILLYERYPNPVFLNFNDEVIIETVIFAGKSNRQTTEILMREQKFGDKINLVFQSSKRSGRFLQYSMTKHSYHWVYFRLDPILNARIKLLRALQDKYEKMMKKKFKRIKSSIPSLEDIKEKCLQSSDAGVCRKAERKDTQ